MPFFTNDGSRPCRVGKHLMGVLTSHAVGGGGMVVPWGYAHLVLTEPFDREDIPTFTLTLSEGFDD